MTLDATARDRLADVRELEPTTNAELADRWGMDSGKDVAAYLRDHLGGQVYRGEDRKLRARNSAAPDAAGVGDTDPGAGQADAPDTDGAVNRQDDPQPSRSDGTRETSPTAGLAGAGGGRQSPEITPQEFDASVQTTAEEARAGERNQRLKDTPCGHDSLDLTHPRAVEIIAEAGAVEKTCQQCGEAWVYGPSEGT